MSETSTPDSVNSTDSASSPDRENSSVCENSPVRSPDKPSAEISNAPLASSPVASLLALARAGDLQARNELFERCRPYVGFVARAQVGSWLQAKVDHSDLVQQTLLEAHRGLQHFRGSADGEWLAWLRRIVNNNAADFVRRFGIAGKRRAALEVSWRIPAGSDSQGLARDPSDPGQTPSQIVLRREEELELSQALSRLPDDYQEVVVLRNLERLPFDEIARRLGRSRPAVQMLWMRAIRKLQELVDP